MVSTEAEVKSLSSFVRDALDSCPPTYESAAATFALIEQGVAHLGGVAAAGLVQPGQLSRFKRSLDWQPDSPGRRMTVAEAFAFLDRLARASEAIVAEQRTSRRGRPIIIR